MRGRLQPAFLLLVLLALLAPAIAAASPPEIFLTSPVPGVPVFGEVEIAAEILAGESPVREVVFSVDGREVGRRGEPPWTVKVDVGQDNAAHRFEVVAETAAGERSRATLVTPAIRVDDAVELELQQLYVTVTRGGERRLDLEAEDFKVFDQGERQELVTFERGDVPIVALLLVDASDSMRGERLEAALEGARAFASGMAPLDEVKLMLFSDRVVHATPFTSFAEIVHTGLAGVEAGGATAINDHLYQALELLEERQGRRVAVLLSDGVDVVSVLRMREVIEVARRSRALIYWIRLGASSGGLTHTSAWRDAREHRQELELLTEAVESSGGRVLALDGSDEIADAFPQVLRELREQYVLGYYPSNSRGDGRWHRVEVEVGRRRHEVRARAGYVDY